MESLFVSPFIRRFSLSPSILPLHRYIYIYGTLESTLESPGDENPTQNEKEEEGRTKKTTGKKKMEGACVTLPNDVTHTHRAQRYVVAIFILDRIIEEIRIEYYSL